MSESKLAYNRKTKQFKSRDKLTRKELATGDWGVTEGEFVLPRREPSRSELKREEYMKRVREKQRNREKEDESS